MKSLDIKVESVQATKLVEPLCAEVNLIEAFSAATLSHLTEPGDRFAGALVDAVGAETTLGMLVNRWEVTDVTRTFLELSQKLAEDFNSDFAKLWTEACARWLPRLNLANLRQSLEQHTLTKGKLITRDSADFPKSLFDLAEATPLVLWLRGNPEVLNADRTLSIVGSRIATTYGQQVSVEIAEVCAQKRVTTVSGGAFGIDSLAHRASLELESPTLAVLAGGLDRLYPRGNAALFEQLLKDNAIIAEVPPGVAPAKWRFLMRNRLIAALGLATVVVEAGKRSGSMSTAGHALELSRPIGVVPGRWTDSSSRGCLNLLRDNPGTVQVLACANDALDLIGLGEPEFELRESMGVLETRALDAFGKRTLGILDVQRIAGLTFSEAQLALGRLELSGHLERQFNGYRRLHHNL